jgi:DNA-directed RNA polymerase specialized sigma24 family protein
MMRRMGGSSRRTAAQHVEPFPARFAGPYQVAFRLLGDAPAAQAIACEALAHAESGLRSRSPRTLAANSCRRAAKLAVRDELWFDRPRSPARGTGFGEIPDRMERRELRMAVRLLHGRKRTLFVLERLAGWSPEEVAAECGLTRDAYDRCSAAVMESISERAAARGGRLQLDGGR